jgi:hypothetical protein
MSFYRAALAIVTSDDATPLPEAYDELFAEYHAMRADQTANELHVAMSNLMQARIALLALATAYTGCTDKFDYSVYMLSKCFPEFALLALVTIGRSTTVPNKPNSLRQLLIAVENIFLFLSLDNHIDMDSRAFLVALLRLVPIEQWIDQYAAMENSDLELIDRIRAQQQKHLL